ncbi:MAG: PD40 domain-containing protein [Spirochaetales bacterium]|nr:PD40 domain-containing protein [Spirochaetales bacterium]
MKNRTPAPWALCRSVSLFLLGILSLTFIACPDERRSLEILPGVFPLTGINTEYDDYNAAPPPAFMLEGNLIYSTNSGTSGEDFDIWRAHISFEVFHNGSMYEAQQVQLSSDAIASLREREFWTDCNSDTNDELGPIVLGVSGVDLWRYDETFLTDNPSYLYCFTQGDQTVPDSLDIIIRSGDDQAAFAGNDASADDGYICFHEASQTVFFCSNRTGSAGGFDIYAYKNTASTPLYEFLTSGFSSDDLSPVTVLNSASDDKCPYVFEDIMVFVSDRNGGSGGFDIYWSRYDGNGWSEPSLFPAQIGPDNDTLNSVSNEYRPALFAQLEDGDPRVTRNLLLTFSSNRTGGQGGYDLFLAVLPPDIFE